MKLEELAVVSQKVQEEILLENAEDLLLEEQAGEWSKPQSAESLFEELGI
jgi:hypothetical protein